MQITKAIKTMIVNRDAKHIDVSEKLGYTKQGFSNLLKKVHRRRASHHPAGGHRGDRARKVCLQL